MDAGWPRPWRDLQESSVRAYEDRQAPARVPAPWMNSSHDDDQDIDWFACRDDCGLAHTQRLCQVCGIALGNSFVLPRAYRDNQTNGGGVHPRCMALSLRFCPHFSIEPAATVAYAYHGPDVGYIPPAHAKDPNDVHETSRATLPGLRALTRADVLDIVVADPLGEHAQWPA